MVNTPTAVWRSDNLVQTGISKVANDFDSTPALSEEIHTAEDGNSSHQPISMTPPSVATPQVPQQTGFVVGDQDGTHLSEHDAASPTDACARQQDLLQLGRTSI